MRLNKKRFYIITVLLLLAATYVGLKNWTGASNDAISSNKIPTNSGVSDLMASMNIYQLSEKMAAPNFSLMSLEGDKTSLAQYRGKVVLISFWATW